MKKLQYKAFIINPVSEDEVEDKDYPKWKNELINCVKEFIRCFGHLPPQGTHIGYGILDHSVIDRYVFTCYQHKKVNEITIYATTL